MDMLSIDHVNNDGAAERRRLGSSEAGSQLYYRLRREGFPEGYVCLCFNHGKNTRLVL